MGQIETKESSNSTNDLSDRKEILRKESKESTSSDLNIKIDDNSDANNETNVENIPKDEQKEKRLKKAKTYDYACKIFYAMVALLVFSTMSRTYSHYSGGGCGTLYGVQPLLAYSCVGLACAIIKSLRKHIKEEINENSEETTEKVGGEEDSTVDNTDGEPNEEKPKKDSLIAQDNTDPFHGFTMLPSKDNIFVNFPVGVTTVDKLSNGLPLPELPPPNSLIRRVTFEKTKEFRPLSAVDLNINETELEKQKNKINETHGFTESAEVKTMEFDWKDLKFDTEMFKKRDSNGPAQFNWNEYNLNSIDKY